MHPPSGTLTPGAPGSPSPVVALSRSAQFPSPASPLLSTTDPSPASARSGFRGLCLSAIIQWTCPPHLAIKGWTHTARSTTGSPGQSLARKPIQILCYQWIFHYWVPTDLPEDGFWEFWSPISREETNHSSCKVFRSQMTRWRHREASWGNSLFQRQTHWSFSISKLRHNYFVDLVEFHKSFPTDDLRFREQELKVRVDVVLVLTVIGCFILIVDSGPIGFQKLLGIVFDWSANALQKWPLVLLRAPQELEETHTVIFDE